jgi:hypothetical protein
MGLSFAWQPLPGIAEVDSSDFLRRRAVPLG